MVGLNGFGKLSYTLKETAKVGVSFILLNSVSSLMHLIQFPSARSRVPIRALLILIPITRDATPLTVLVRYPANVPTFPICPLMRDLAPVSVNFKGELNAPAASLLAQLWNSESNSASVGNLNPDGHGLFIPSTPCHKLSFAGDRQSLLAKMNKECLGSSVLDELFVVVDVVHLKVFPIDINLRMLIRLYMK